MDRERKSDTRCRRCGHEWFSKVILPKQCPNCKFFKLEGRPVVEKIQTDNNIMIRDLPHDNNIMDTPEPNPIISKEEEWF